MKTRVASFLFVSLLAAAAAHAAPLSFSYGGRLTAGDSAVKGPVDLELRFYRVASGGSPIAEGNGPIVASFSGVALDDGVFQVEVAVPGVLSAAQLHQLFDGAEAVYVEVTDKTSGGSYARQRLVSMPYALKVPVDGSRARFGADGKLTVGPSGNAGANEFLTTDANGNFVWQAPASGGGSGTVTSIAAGSGLTGGTITGSGTIGLASPMPALDGSALTNVNAVKLYGRTVSSSSPSTGQVLKWDGTNWSPAADNSGGALASDAVTAAEIATDAVTAAEIADGSITNADISGTAAIATSKLSGAVTSIAGHGLGSLATLSAVSSTEITNGTIVDADISGSAAIADAKLATISTAGKVSGGAITSGSIGGTAAFTGSGGVTTTGAIFGSGNVKLGGTGAATTDLRFYDSDNTNYVGLKASGSVGSDLVWTLPAADGSAGQVLATNGGGVLSWSTPSGSGDMLMSANLAGLTNLVTARSNLGLGALSTLAVVGTAEISDGTIANADISGTAAIATSKLSGPVTWISGHGLGALATASAVGSSEITDGAVSSTDIADGTIANADISGTAAIATSKLSGSLTAVSGHGLSALATLSAVSTAEITDGTIANADIAPSAAIDASKIANGAVSSMEFQYLDGLTGSIQAQLDAKASAASPNFAGAISAASGSSVAPSYSFTGDTNTGVWSSGADTVNVSTAGSERLRVTSTGNVGIGTAVPMATLHVSGTTKLGASGTSFSGLQAGTTSVSFPANPPISFSTPFTAVPHVVATAAPGADNCNAIEISTVSTTSFTISAFQNGSAVGSGTCNVNWIAIAP
jgi:hypothetical protein